VSVTVTKNELKLVLNKLDTVRLELLRLRAMLLPEEEATEEEKKELKKARKEIEESSGINLEALIKELGWLHCFKSSSLQEPENLSKNYPNTLKEELSNYFWFFEKTQFQLNTTTSKSSRDIPIPIEQELVTSE